MKTIILSTLIFCINCATSTNITARKQCISDRGECIFPFLYDDKYFNGCTTYKNNEVLNKVSDSWCATVIDIETKKVLQFGICKNCPQNDNTGSTNGTIPNTPPKTTPCDAQYGEPCIFPFSHRGRRFYQCTTYVRYDERRGPWCATRVSSYGVAKRWKNCSRSCEIDPVGFSSSLDYCETDVGEICIFPFVYDNRIFTGCTEYNDNNEKLYAIKNAWCATKVDEYLNMIQFGECKENKCDMDNLGSPYKGTIIRKHSCNTFESNEVSCIFPFVYLGLIYDGCVLRMSKPRFMCPISLYANMTAKEWRKCGDDCPTQVKGSKISRKANITVTFIESRSIRLNKIESNCLSVDGEKCIFPYTYNGTQYRKCLKSGGLSWCAIQVDNATTNTATQMAICSSSCNG